MKVSIPLTAQGYIRDAAEMKYYILLDILYVFRWFRRCTTLLLRDSSKGPGILPEVKSRSRDVNKHGGGGQ